MSYEKHTWETGETITADSLNHLEQGLADCYGDGTNILIVKVDYNQSDLSQTPTAVIADKTYEEIMAAFQANKLIQICARDTSGAIVFLPYVVFLPQAVMAIMSGNSRDTSNHLVGITETTITITSSGATAMQNSFTINNR